MSLVKFCLITGSIMHIAGLMVYAQLPYVYLLSVLILSIGYYLYLQQKEYKPFLSVSFWGMVFVLSIPIVGLIAGFQKMLVIPTQGSKLSKQANEFTTLVTLLLAIPIVVFFSALIMPMFPNLSPFVMKSILIVAGGVELFLLITIITRKNRSDKSLRGKQF